MNRGGTYEQKDLFEMMYREMFWTSEGYLWEKVQQGNLDMDQMEEDFDKLIKFWKSVYLRKKIAL